MSDTPSAPDSSSHPEERLAAVIKAVRAPAPELYESARAHIDALTKPKGSMGRLEEAAERLFAVRGGALPLSPDPARFFTVAADHGVCAEKINSAPQEVTRQQVVNFLAGGGGINAMCEANGIDLVIVDAGVAGPAFDAHPMLVRARIAEGSANLAVEPAMTRDECLAALALGLDLAEDAAKSGYRTVGTGEMGIGNTTPSAALFCAYLGASPAAMTGPGAGVPPIGLAGKTRVIEKALRTHADVIRGGDPVAVLAALGGLEIATIAGIILGGAAMRLAVVIDGFIATAAFTAARAMAPQVAAYCFFAHSSGEPGHKTALEKLGVTPYLDLGLRLGEGTGAALFLPLLRSAAAMYNGMRTFASAGVTES